MNLAALEERRGQFTKRGGGKKWRGDAGGGMEV